MLKTLNESATHSLNSRAKAIRKKHSSRRLTSEFRISLVGRLELQIGHLQKAGIGLDKRNAQFVTKMRKGIRVIEDPTKVIFHSN
jgi:hypothetical protein